MSATATTPAVAPAATATATQTTSSDEENLLRGLNKLRTEDKLTDVTLIVEDHRFKVG